MRLIQKIEEWTWNDAVSSIYGRLFTDQVVYDPYLEPKQIDTDAKRRKAQKIPPGYKDTGNGDIVIWHTILDLAKAKKQHLIFVSGDEKTDWYHQSNKQALYPRYELVDEYRRSSDGHSFHIIPFSTLLKLEDVAPQIVAEIAQEEILEARRSVESLPGSNYDFTAHFAETAVAKWFQEHLPLATIDTNQDGPIDFAVSSTQGRIGVVVKFVRSTETLGRRLREIRTWLEGFDEKLALVLVAPDHLTAVLISQALGVGERRSSPLRIPTRVGTLDRQDTFNPLPEIGQPNWTSWYW